jgi:hypothetical protein
MGLTQREKDALDRYLLEPKELEDEEIDPEGSCKRPGRNGCHHCSACADWGDWEYHRRRDKELEDL